MSYRRKLSNLASSLGDEAVDQLVSLLDKEARAADAPWKRTLLDLLVETMRDHGPEGLKIAQGAVERMLDGDRRDIRKITKNLLLASNLLAQLQNAEAARKERVRKWLKALVSTLSAVVKAALGALL
jgi:hypothetical protein